MAYPNAGLPNDLGEYDEAAHETARQVAEWVADGLVNVVGGCCGTTPDHIAAIATRNRRKTAKNASRQVPTPRFSPASSIWCSQRDHSAGAGARFVNIGERTNVTGSAQVQETHPRRRL